MTWDLADLEARLCRALDIAGKALALFADDGYADTELPENSFGPDKLIAESAMLIYAASAANQRPAVAQRVAAIADLLSTHARTARTRLKMALHPSLCLDLAFPHILLSQLGYRDAGFDAFLRSCLDSRARDGRERPPVAAAEKLWIEALWRGTQPDRSWQRCLRESVLGRGLDLLGGQRDDSYALTHLFMYCTNFGFSAACLPRRRSLILTEAASLLARCIDAEDYDLAGEIVLAWPLSAAPWSAPAAFGFRVLTAIEDDIGVLPGGTTRAERLQRLHGSERERYVFGTAYHTAYVTGLLCAASLRPNRAPPKRISGPRLDPGLLDQLVALVDHTQGHWQKEFFALSRPEQESLGTFLLDIVITQTCRKRDYATLHRLLALAHTHPSALSPLCGDAAELLVRLAACAETTEISALAANRS